MVQATLRTDMPPLIGGCACLDFANTAGGRGGEHPDEYLGSYARLVSWSRYAGLLSDMEERRLLEEAERRPDEADRVYRWATELRETIYRIFSAFGRNERPAQDDMDRLKRAHLRALEHARLGVAGRAARWEWGGEEYPLDRVLWPLVESAVELVTSSALDRVRECPGAMGPCTWLFLDTSKGGKRRWCSMSECGGIFKARRQTARRRAMRARPSA